MKKKLLAVFLCLTVVLWAQTVYKVTGADAIANTLVGYFASNANGEGVLLATAPHTFNGTSWDRARGQCDSYAPINTTTNVRIITGVSAKKVYICSFNLIAGAATNVALVEGTGSACATNTVGLAGGATAATGWNFAANGGISHGNGAAYVARTTVNANDVCILVSAANQVSGGITYSIY